jgi:hypothetical protein
MIQNKADYEYLDTKVTQLLIFLIQKEKIDSTNLVQEITFFCKEHGTKSIKYFVDNVLPLLNDLIDVCFNDEQNIRFVHLELVKLLNPLQCQLMDTVQYVFEHPLYLETISLKEKVFV